MIHIYYLSAMQVINILYVPATDKFHLVGREGKQKHE